VAQSNCDRPGRIYQRERGLGLFVREWAAKAAPIKGLINKECFILKRLVIFIAISILITLGFRLNGAVNRASQFDNWQESVARASDPDDTVFAAITEWIFSRKEEAEAILLQARKNFPNDILVNHQIVEFCSENSSKELCTQNSILNLLNQDPQNGYLHFKFAVIQYADGDHSDALESLKNVANSDRVDSYWWRYLEAADRSQARFGIGKGYRRLVGVYGLPSLATSRSLQGFTAMCDQQIENEVDGWAAACAEASNTLAEKSLTSIMMSLGSSHYIKYTGGSLGQVEQARNAIVQKISVLGGKHESIVNKLMPLIWLFGDADIDDKLWRTYIFKLSSVGEFDAQNYFFDKLEDDFPMGFL